MAKTSYLNLVNRVLNRIQGTEVATVVGMTGKAATIGNMMNEGQLVIMQEMDCYDLYETTTFVTVAGTAEYAAPTDLNKTINLMDVTNDRPIVETDSRDMDDVDPNADSSNLPTHFAVQGSNYRLHPIPSGVFTIRVRYWKIPATLATDAATSDLNIELEPALIAWAWGTMLANMNQFEKSDRIFSSYDNKLIPLAKKSNRKRLDRLNIFGPKGPSRFGIEPAKLGGRYGAGF